MLPEKRVEPVDKPLQFLELPFIILAIAQSYSRLDQARVEDVDLHGNTGLLVCARLGKIIFNVQVAAIFRNYHFADL